MKNNKDEEQDNYCHFCGRGPGEYTNLLKSPSGAHICEDCARQAVGLFDESRGKPKQKVKPIGRIPTPREIVAALDEYVVGQDDTKKTLAVAVYNHYCRLAMKDGYDAGGRKLSKKDLAELGTTEVEKSNVLMIGPTGCGKTMLARTIAKILNVPFAIADATTLTEAGYVGEDVENIVRYLFNNADHNIPMTMRGICWIDEIDKIAGKTQNVSLTRDVSGEGVQQALLKIIEGTICRFPENGGRKHPDQKLIEVDTRDILFICGGAFVGLDKIVESRIAANSHSRIGFHSDEDQDAPDKANTDKKVRPEDLVQYGLIPEFVGRLPVVAEMSELNEDELMRVMTEPRNAITKQYQKLLRLSNVSIEFDEASLRKMAKKAIERKTGARGIKAEMETLMREVMFTAPDNRGKRKEIKITENMI